MKKDFDKLLKECQNPSFLFDKKKLKFAI